MHKTLLVLLALAMLVSFAACQNTPVEPSTTNTTPPPGLSTTPSGFEGFDGNTATDPTQSTTEATVAPIEGTTEPTAEPTTEPTVGRPTEPTTEPADTPTNPGTVSISPDAEGFIYFTNLKPDAQYEFFKEFGSDPAAFDTWLDTAEAAFREKYPEYVYTGGPIILPDRG